MSLPRADFLVKTLIVALLAACLVLSGMPGTNSSGASGGRSRYYFKRVERCMMKKINKRRVGHGLPKLDWDRQLGYVARRHSARMARAGTIFHDNALGSKITRWRSLGQNVGMAHDGCKKLFRAFWESSPHRSNIMGRWRFVGVGSKRRNGRLYVQHVFESRRNPGNIYTYP